MQNLKAKKMAQKVKFLGTGHNDNKGQICFGAAIGGDYTLCGTTLDFDEQTAGDWEDTREKVNCDYCIQIVKFCKSISVKQYKNATN